MNQSTLTKAFYGITLAFGLLPLATSVMDIDEDLQAGIRSGSWTLASLTAFTGSVREGSKSLLEERILADGNRNGNLALARQANMARVELGMTRIDLQTTLQQGNLSASSSIALNTTIPEALVQFALPRTMSAIAEQQVIASQREGVFKGVVPGSIALKATSTAGTVSMAGAEFTDQYIDAAYQYVMSLDNRNSLSTLIFGASGDCKTAMLHNMLFQRLKLEPDTVVMMCDRKNMSMGETGQEQWGSTWFGLPVYPDGPDPAKLDAIRQRTDITDAQKMELIRSLPRLDAIHKMTQTDVPFPSVYASVNPRLDLWFAWIDNYLQKWRYSAPISLDGEYVEKDIDVRSQDPLWSHQFNRPRPILVIADDATQILADMDMQHRKVANDLASRIATLYRSENVHLIIVAHGNTQTDLGFSGTTLDAFQSIMGASFCENQLKLTHSRVKFPEAGIKRAYADMNSKVKGFATSFEEYPYLPPPRLDISEGLNSYIIPELAIEWHRNIPMPYMVKPLHKKAFAKMGMEYLPGEGVISITEANRIRAAAAAA